MIEVRHARKRFGKLVALDDVSLRIEPGERVALIGSNGSGKTTLLRALCGLVRIEGTVEIDGVDVARAPERALRTVAYMPQSAPPLDAPVRELVRAYAGLRGLSRERIAAEAARLGLTLDEVERTRVRDLSGGMKQKLLAALSLATDAPILVCDEPTASLDAAAREALFEALSARPDTSTLILCCHRLEEVRGLVERVVELRDGRVVSDARLVAPAPETRPVPRLVVEDERAGERDGSVTVRVRAI